MITHKLAAVAFAAAVTASVGSAQAATPQQGANGVVYGSGGSPAATYSSSASSWTLAAPTSPGGSAQIDLVRPGGPDAIDAPTFTASAYSAGGPRWVIEFHDGCTLTGTPTAAGSGTFTWAENPGGDQSTDWYSAFIWVTQTCGSDDEVTAAYIVDGSAPGGTPATLTDVTFNDEPVVPYSSGTTQSPLGPVRNAYSGKCLDVTNGAYADGTKLQQWTCGADGGANQHFEIVAKDTNGTETGYLEAVSPAGTVLYVSAATPGGRLTLSSTRTVATDMLKSGPYYGFPEVGFATASDPYVLDDSGFSTASGAKIISYFINRGANQRWSLP